MMAAGRLIARTAATGRRRLARGMKDTELEKRFVSGSYSVRRRLARGTGDDSPRDCAAEKSRAGKST